MTHGLGADLGRATTLSNESRMDDLACAACGYNLRGLSADGRCPECGLEIVHSLSGEKLIHADVTWLEKLLLGQTLIHVASISGTCVASVLVMSDAGLWWGTYFNSALAWGLSVLLPATVWMIFIAGVFFITMPEPRICATVAPCTARRITRRLALASFATAALGWTLPNLPLRMASYLALTIRYRQAIALLVALLTYLTFVGLLWHLASLADRLGSDSGKLSTQVRQIRRYLVIFGIGSIPWFILLPMQGAFADRWVMNLLAMAWLFILAFLWLGLWTIKVLGTLRGALQQALSQARTQRLIVLARSHTGT